MMRKSVDMSDSPYLPVVKTPLFTQDGSQSTRMSVILDPEQLAMEVGTVSADYKLVPNQDVEQVAADVLERAGLSSELSSIYFDGKHFRKRWILPDLSIEPRLGDFVQVAIDAHNSYDGSSTFGLAFNLQRLVCGNGMVVDFQLGGYRFRHYGSDSFERELDAAVSKIMELAGKMELIVPRLRSLTETPLSRADTQMVFSELSVPKILQAEVYQKIEEDNWWGLYNAFTDVLSHNNTYRSDLQNRQVSRYFLEGGGQSAAA
jgi:hypothetical protein